MLKAQFYLLVGKQNIFLAIWYITKMKSNLISTHKFGTFKRQEAGFA